MRYATFSLPQDPTLRVAHPEDTGQIVLWTLGEAHADLVLDRLRSRYGVEVDSAELRASLRETFSSGGSGIRPSSCATLVIRCCNCQVQSFQLPSGMCGQRPWPSGQAARSSV